MDTKGGRGNGMNWKTETDIYAPPCIKQTTVEVTTVEHRSTTQRSVVTDVGRKSRKWGHKRVRHDLATKQQQIRTSTVVIIFSWNTLSGTHGQQRPLADSPLLAAGQSQLQKASILYIQTSQCLVNRQQKDTVTSKNYENSKLWLFQATKF